MRTEDLRGRRFAWRVETPHPLVAPIVEEGWPCGGLFRAPEEQGSTQAEFVGMRYWAEHTPGVLGPKIRLWRDEALAAETAINRMGELTVTLGGRAYTLRTPAPNLSTWHDGVQDAVSFRLSRAADSDGEAFVLMAVEVEDAPILTVLGMVLGLEHGLFVATSARPRILT